MSDQALPRMASARPLLDSPRAKQVIANSVLIGATGLVLVAAVVLYTLQIATPRVGGLDEGVYLLVARLLREGYAPSAIVWDQPPLFTLLLGWGMALGGDSLLTARLMIVGFSLVALLALARLPQAWHAKYAIPIVLLLTVTDAYLLMYSRQVLGEVPCLAFLLASLAAMAQYGDSNRRGWLVASGVLFALAVAIKPIAAGFSVMFGLILATDAIRLPTRAPRTMRRRLVDLVWFGGSAAMIMVPTLGLYNPGLFWRDVIGLHLAENGTRYGEPKGNWRGLLFALERNLPITLLAVPGIWAALHRNARLTLAMLAGLVATVGVLFLLPPFLHHYTLLMPFLALFAGIGIWQGIEFVAGFATGAPGPTPRWEWIYLGVLGCSVILAASQVYASAQDAAGLIMQSSTSARARLDFVKKEVAPGEFVLSDSPMLAYLAGAQMPPCGILLAYPHDWLKIPDRTALLTSCLKEYPVNAVLQTGEYVREAELWDLLHTEYPTKIEGPAMEVYTRS